MGGLRKNTIAIINGPNINLLGVREPENYGRTTWSDIEKKLVNQGKELGINLIFYQSNHEGFIVDFIQENLMTLNGIVLNPAGYSKTGYAILDALTAIYLPYVEVHLSNIFERGEWHAETIFSEKAIGIISGFRENVYKLGLEAICDYLNR